MQKGSYIWNITIEYRWDYEFENEDDCNTKDFTIAAPTFETACSKVMKVFMQNHKTWNDKVDGILETHSIKEAEIIKIERDAWIDG